MLGGLFSGFFSGLLGMGGAIRGIALLAAGLSKEIFVVTSAVVALAIDTARVGYYISDPSWLTPYGVHCLILTVSSIGGVFLGRYLLARLNPLWFRRLVLIVLIIAGLKIAFF